MNPEDVLKNFYLPLWYDVVGQQIFDDRQNLVADIRGWGRLQYLDNPEQIQDGMGNLIVNAFNEKYHKV
jgi:hypothetical protein